MGANVSRLIVAVLVGSVVQFVLSFVVFFVLTIIVARIGVPPYAEAVGMVINQVIFAIAIGIAVLYSHRWKRPTVDPA
jgi:Na+-driven multidrug efflux pump